MKNLGKPEVEGFELKFVRLEGMFSFVKRRYEVGSLGVAGKRSHFHRRFSTLGT